MKKTMAIALAGLALGACATSTTEGWTDDFEAAKAQAAAEGKLLLVDFSGSDWCGWCKRLDKEVFSKPEFLEGVKNDFVLVMVDSPNDKSLLSEKAKKQNPELVEKYSVEGFPTVLVMDSSGKVLEKTGYRRGGPKPYVEYLLKAKKEAAAALEFEKALSTLERGSPERLAKIDEYLSGLDEEGLIDNEALAAELFADGKNGATYAAKYPFLYYVKPARDKAKALFKGLNDEVAKRITPDMRDADGEIPPAKLSEIRRAVDPIVLERISALKAELEAQAANAPESAKKDLSEIAGQLGKIAEGIKEESAKK